MGPRIHSEVFQEDPSLPPISVGGSRGRAGNLGVGSAIPVVVVLLQDGGRLGGRASSMDQAGRLRPGANNKLPIETSFEFF